MEHEHVGITALPTNFASRVEDTGVDAVKTYILRGFRQESIIKLTLTQLTFTSCHSLLLRSAAPLVHQYNIKIPSFFDSLYRAIHSTKMKFTSTLLVLGIAALTNARAVWVRQNNAQTFTGALGGVAATPVLDSGIANRPFSVKGDTFVNLSGALQRSCDQQFNGCANLANGGNGNFSTQECQAQKG